MIIIKDDQKCQGTITFKKMWEMVSVEKGTAQLNFIRTEKALHNSAQRNL